MNRLIAPGARRNKLLRDGALARWDNEGGAPAATTTDRELRDLPQSASAELAQLRIRMIALENLVITLLAQGSERQLDLGRWMAAHVSPRPGFTHHRVTLHAATQMRHLIKRAGWFRDDSPSDLRQA